MIARVLRVANAVATLKSEMRRHDGRASEANR